MKKQVLSLKKPKIEANSSQSNLKSKMANKPLASKIVENYNIDERSYIIAKKMSQQSKLILIKLK